MPAIVASRQLKLLPPQWKSDKYSPANMDWTGLDHLHCCKHEEYIIKSEPLHKNQWLEREGGNAMDTDYEKRIKTIHRMTALTLAPEGKR